LSRWIIRIARRLDIDLIACGVGPKWSRRIAEIRFQTTNRLSPGLQVSLFTRLFVLPASSLAFAYSPPRPFAWLHGLL
jgi:hypothetical protein